MGCGCGNRKVKEFAVTMKDGSVQMVPTRAEALSLVRKNPGSSWHQTK